MQLHRAVDFSRFVGPVNEGEAVLERTARSISAINAIDHAEASVETALNEGRTLGFDEAREMLTSACAALDRGDYDNGVALADSQGRLSPVTHAVLEREKYVPR